MIREERGLSWPWIAGMSVVVFVILLCIYPAQFFHKGPFGDEMCYLAAARMVLAVGEARDVFGWYYPDVFAAIFAAIARTYGEQALLHCLRVVNGLGIAVWIALCAEVLISCTRRRYMPVYIMVMVYTPMVRDAFVWGNIGSALFLPFALAIGAKLPMARAFFLALSCTIKPYGLGAALGQRHLWLALVVVLALHAGGGSGDLSPFLLFSGNGSFARGFAVLGIPWQMPVALALAGAFLFGRGSWSRGVCFSWLALPIVWPHTSVMILFPIATAFARWLLETPSERTTALLLWTIPENRALGLVATLLVAVVANQTSNFLPLSGRVFEFLWPQGVPSWIDLLWSEFPAGAVLLLLFLTRDPPCLQR